MTVACVPSGVNDTDSLNEKILEAQASDNFLELRYGTYILSGGGLDIPSVSGFRMFGAGIRNTVLQYSGSSDAVTVGSGALPSVLDVTFEGFKLSGSLATGNGLVLADYCSQPILRDVWVTGFSNGTGVKLTNHNFSAYFENVRADSNLDGFYIGDQAQNFRGIGCRASTNSRYGVHIFDTNTVNLHGWQVEKNSTAGILAQGVTGLSIFGIYNEQNSSYPGPFLICEAGDTFGTCRSVGIYGGRCLGNGDAADCIVLHAMNGMVVSGLRIQTFTTTSIKDDPVAPATVINIWNGGGNVFDVAFTFDQPALIP